MIVIRRIDFYLNPMNFSHFVNRCRLSLNNIILCISQRGWLIRVVVVGSVYIVYVRQLELDTVCAHNFPLIFLPYSPYETYNHDIFNTFMDFKLLLAMD